MAKTSHQKTKKITQIRHLSKPQRKFYYLEKNMLPPRVTYHVSQVRAALLIRTSNKKQLN
jgi:hypothetical protein